MKKFKDISEFENLLKGELTNHSVPAPPDVWSAVSSSVAGNSVSVLSQVTSYFSSVTNILKVALFAGGISAVGVILYTSNTEKPEQTTEETSRVEEILQTPGEELSEDVDGSTIIQNSTEQNRGINPPINNKNTNSGSNENSENITKPASDKTAVDVGLTPSSPQKADLSVAPKANDASIALALFASNSTPCKGETVILTNTRKEKGTWLENGKPIAQNVAELKYNCNKEGVVNISFQGTEHLANGIIRVQSVKASIISNAGLDGNFTLGLSNNNLSANWFVDGKLIATNAKETTYQILQTGKHVVKAVIVNHTCSAEFSNEIVVNSENKVELFDIFTPDGDGKNDYYVVKIENYEYFSIRIFDKENGLVFEAQNPNIQWDGRIQASGMECPNGEYIAKLSYKLIGKNPILKNLKITLIRD
jgi:gliding motility-associated-like protein